VCELNPKRKAFYRLEFFTAQDIPEIEWNQLVVEKLLMLEQYLNESGKIRVHIHEELTA
jgi:hypothetical protein